jgi:hypothetical protein
MSTYIRKGKNPNHEIILGWDPALNTYFLHVIDKTKNEDDKNRDVLWIGCTQNEITDIDDLAKKAFPYLRFSELWEDLYADANQ